MLENTRRQGASVFLYIVFGVLIAAFVLGINPGNQGESGCMGSSNTFATVDGSKVHKNEYFVARNNRFTSSAAKGQDRDLLALDLVIRRELLAQAATDHGLRVTDDMIQDEVKAGWFYVGGERFPMGESIFDYQKSAICDVANPSEDCKKPCLLREGIDMCSPGYLCTPDEGSKAQGLGVCDARCTPGGNQCGKGELCTEQGRCAYWNPNKFRSWLAQLNVSKRSYLSEQARSMQAHLMQQVLIGEAPVATDEAKTMWRYRKTTVSYDTVAFSPATYRQAFELSDADVQRYLAKHEPEVKAKYEADKRMYTNVKPQLKLREIYIKAEPAKPAESKPADGKPADGKPADGKPAATTPAAGKPGAVALDQAKAKLEAARAAIAAGRRKFADVARELSTDDALKRDAGLVGWRTADNAQLGDKKLSDAVKALEPGQMTPVITLDKGSIAGAYLIVVEGKRPTGGAKDLSYDDVKLEIAEQLARDTYSKEAAKRAALAALAELTKSGQKLSEAYKASTPGAIPQQIEHQLDAPPPAEGGNQSGARDDVEIHDIPVGWKAEDANGASGGGSGSAAAGSAQPAGAGSAKPGTPAAAPTAPTTPPAPTAPAPAAPAIEPSKDELPAMRDVPRPTVTSHPASPRRASLPGVPKEAVAVLFDQLTPGQLAPRVFEATDGSYVLVQLTAKGEPNVKQDLAKELPMIVEQLQTLRGRVLVNEWLRTRCEALQKDDKIEVRPDLLVERNEKGELVQQRYAPCRSFQTSGF